MLILSRKIDEGVTVTGPDGREWHVMVCGIRNACGEQPSVKLGFTADRDIHVRRDELKTLHVTTEGGANDADGDSNV